MRAVLPACTQQCTQQCGLLRQFCFGGRNYRLYLVPGMLLLIKSEGLIVGKTGLTRSSPRFLNCTLYILFLDVERVTKWHLSMDGVFFSQTSEAVAAQLYIAELVLLFLRAFGMTHTCVSSSSSCYLLISSLKSYFNSPTS